MKIGIFGGSFNPIHNAHLSILNSFIDEFKLDLCYLVPTNQSPFKDAPDIEISSFHKINMLESLFENSIIRISDFDLIKDGPTFTIDTLNHIKTLQPDSSFYLLIGQDQAENFKTWKDWEIVLRIANLVIACRDSQNHMDLDLIIEDLSSFGNIVKRLPTHEMDISSSQIRNLIKNGLNADNYLPKKVHDYITNHELYKV